jgi:hypothetical protein
VKLLSSLALAVLLLVTRARGGPFFQANDVVALVGGEEMVAAAEQGELELRLVRALPELHLKFRSLAWEGDTVFEQPRDLNYPTLEQQLDDTGATVVLALFGVTECLADSEGMPKFEAAYEKLIDRLAAGGKRRVALIAPATPRSAPLYPAMHKLAERRQLPLIVLDSEKRRLRSSYRADGLHLSEAGQRELARSTLETLLTAAPNEPAPSTEEFRLADAIRAKNKLWFHYARPQNWAFLNGDRTIQPSSRDHLDPSKRWFPEEMKEWLPLIAQKETEIWKLSAGPNPR